MDTDAGKTSYFRTPAESSGVVGISCAPKGIGDSTGVGTNDQTFILYWPDSLRLFYFALTLSIAIDWDQLTVRSFGKTKRMQ